MELLDNQNVIKQRDPQGALAVAAEEWKQLLFAAEVIHRPTSKPDISKIIVTGMGGSALAAGMAKDWLDLPQPFEVIKGYTLPKYVDPQTLVIASSYSGNTEETLSALAGAKSAGAMVAVITSGGELLATAQNDAMAYVQLESGMQPRMAVLANLTALIALLEKFGLIVGVTEQLQEASSGLEAATAQWLPSAPGEHNQAKQLAAELLGKTPVVYASGLMRSVAYKWKISFNENAKNVAFMNELPEFNHNEFMGWVSHPVQKPFGVIDLRSDHDHPQIKKRFEISDRLLSGMRPKATVVNLQGRSLLEQMLWGSVLADFASIYLAILNGVDPTPVELIEKLKKELV